MAHSSSIRLWSFYTDDLRRVEVCKIEMSHLYWEWGECDNVYEWCNLYFSSMISQKLMDTDGHQMLGNNSRQFSNQSKAISREIIMIAKISYFNSMDLSNVPILFQSIDMCFRVHYNPQLSLCVSMCPSSSQSTTTT